MDTFSRRRALHLAGGAVGGAALLTVTPRLTDPAFAGDLAGDGSSAGSSERPKPRWRGHQPGKVFLGMSSVAGIRAATADTGRVGLQRSFFGWNDGAREDAIVKADHAAGRLPWISYKPPSSARGGWNAISSGRHDRELRARARRYAGYKKTTIVTFHHEPTNDNTGTGAEYARAYVHCRRIIRDEIGSSHIRFVPIIGDWAFNPQNRDRNAGQYLTEEVLHGSSFLGIDLYQNASLKGYGERLGHVVNLLERRGFPDKMIGLGETGSTDHYGGSAARWWTKQWNWCQAHTGRITAVSYFNSSRNSRSGVYWPLDESAAKTRVYRESLRTNQATRLG